MNTLDKDIQEILQWVKTEVPIGTRGRKECITRLERAAIEADRQSTNEWRKLALQFDSHRMQAISHLKAIVDHLPFDMQSPIRNFLSSPPDRQAVGEPVAYLDLGVGGYMDVGTDLTDEQLAALPKGRHMLGIVGTYGVDGYREVAPQPQQIPEGYKQTLRDFFAALDKANALDKPSSAWVNRPNGSFGDRLQAWAEVNRLRAMLEAAPEVKP